MTNDIAIRYCDEYLARHIADIDKEFLEKAKEALQQEPKTGHWIEERTYMECPNCHDVWHYEENQTERFKFCPNCGGMAEGSGE